jgi:hypothetical protein
LLGGTYVLVLVPGTGNNIVNGDFLCDSADPGAFALSPDLATEGDTITFIVGGTTPPPRTITQWRSVRTHSGAPGEQPIVLNPALSGNGGLNVGPNVETRGVLVTVGATTMGVQKVQVDFNGTITLANAANITVTYRVTTPGFPATMGGPIVTVPSSVALADADTLNILFAAAQIPNMSCININIGPGTLAETITGDADCNIRSLAGDTNTSGTVTITDVSQTKAQLAPLQPVPPAQRFDFNLSGGLTVTDQSFVKGQNVSPTKTALCP